MRPFAAIRRGLLSPLLLLASLLLALLAAEGALRLLAPQILLQDPDAFDHDPVLGGRLRPGFEGRFSSPEYDTRWVINASGHRGDRAGPRVPGRFRVAAVGDSFTFGYGVEAEEAWPARLSSLLPRRGDATAEVINLGIGGYGTVQEVTWLAENLESALDPDLVILGFYPGNDLSDSVRGLAARAARPDEAGGAARAAPPPPSRSLKVRRWLGRRLHLYSFVSERADGLLLRLGMRSVVYAEEIDVLRRPEPDGIAAGWGAVRTSLAELAGLARSHGFDVIVAGIPMRHQVSPGSWERVRKWERETSGMDLSGVDLDAPRRRLVEVGREAGLEVIDLAPALRKEPDPARLYFARDQHLSAWGHERVAAALAAAVSAGSGISDHHLGGGPPVDPDDGRGIAGGERP